MQYLWNEHLFFLFKKSNLGPKQGAKGSWNESRCTDNCLKTGPPLTAIHGSSIPLNKVFSHHQAFRATGKPHLIFYFQSSAVSLRLPLSCPPCACPTGAGAAQGTVARTIQWSCPARGSGPSCRLPTSSHLGVSYVTVNPVGGIRCVLFCL